MKLSNIAPAGIKEPTLLSRVLWPDPSLDHFRSHLPALVEQLTRASASFRSNTSHIKSLYGPDGQLKPGVSHTDLGDAQTHSWDGAAGQVRTASSPKDYSRSSAPMKHLMFESGGEESSYSSDEDEHGVPDFFAPGEDSDDSDNDHLAPIVISDDDDDESDDDFKGSSKKSAKKRHFNSRKRKR